jgi:hypothetical protein
MPCLECGRDFHDECDYGNCNECHPNVEKLVKTFTATGAPVKNPQDVTDPKSTGRKRAAQLYPIFEDAPCEWQGKKNCGGGKYPIVGCIDGKQRHRHHGPVKNTLRNESGNVSRICHNCHNRWHALNDPVYDEVEYSKLPHTPLAATEMELLASEAKWRIKS